MHEGWGILLGLIGLGKQIAPEGIDRKNGKGNASSAFAFPHLPAQDAVRYGATGRLNREKMAAMSQRSVSLRISLVIVVSVLSVVLSQAQQHKAGGISGHVVDSVGATIKGAAVFVHKQGSGERAMEIATHSDIKGNFILALPAGGYDILVIASGFEAGVQTIAMQTGKSKSVEWRLKALGCDFPNMNCDTVQ